MFISYAKNKGADQPAHPRSLISAFVVRYLDCIVPLVSISNISSLCLASAAAQAGLSLPWSQTLKTDFVMTRLKYKELNRLLGSCIHFLLLINELEYDKTNKMTCVPSKDSDQPEQLRAQGSFMRTAKTLIRLGRYPG